MSRQQGTARDLRLARRHLQLAIARLDRLHLSIPAAHADLALAKLDEIGPEEPLVVFRLPKAQALLQ